MTNKQKIICFKEFNVALDYFKDLNTKTDTRFWINNPSSEEVRLALAQGAVNCTTNPAYCSKLMKSEPEYITRLIDKVVLEYPDIEKAAVVIYQRASKRIMDMFTNMYNESNGTQGFVTIQDDPRMDFSKESTINAVFENKKLGRNYMAKIPVIQGGIEAIEVCVEKNIPICATEVFSISQAVHICEEYKKACDRTGNTPALYVTHISGIFDEYLGKFAARNGIAADSELLKYAGLSVARKEYAIIKKMGYNVTLLGGGARGMHHFTGLVGGDAHITMNWSTAQDIINSDIIVENAIDIVTPQKIIDELKEKFVDFRRAYENDGLAVSEFAEFGPVQLFRNSFLKGWHLLIAEVASRKAAKAL